MNTRRVPIISFSVIVCLLFPVTVFGYSVKTHAYLTSETIGLYEHAFPNQSLSGKDKELLISGSVHEDEFPRFMNHFYDPVYDRGLVYDPAIDPLVNVGEWIKSKEWADNESAQKAFLFELASKRVSASENVETNFTWRDAIRRYTHGDRDGAMYALGHVIHLIQDSSVPDHTRNDPHPPFDEGGSPFENWTERFSLDSPDPVLQDRARIKNIPDFPTIGQYFDALAEYSSRNFYSNDTIGIQSGYSSPSPEYEELDGEYVYAFRRDPEGAYRLFVREKENAWSSLLSLKGDTKLFLAKEEGGKVMSDYWSRLGPIAVRYGAGVISLFFEETERFRMDLRPLGEEPDSWTENLVVSILGSVSRLKDVVNIGVTTFKGVFQRMFRGDSEYVFQVLGSADTSDASRDDAMTFDDDVPVLWSDETYAPRRDAIPRSREHTAEPERVVTVPDTGHAIGPVASPAVVPAEGSALFNNVEKISEVVSESFARQYPGKVLISEVGVDGGEFVELYNPNRNAISLSGYYFAYYSQSRSDWGDPWRKKEFPEDVVVPPGGYTILAFGNYDILSDWFPYRSDQLGNRAGSIAVFWQDPSRSDARRVDALGWGSVVLSEGDPAAVPPQGGVLARKSVSDTDRNAFDFSVTMRRTPGSGNEIVAPVSNPPSGDEPSQDVANPDMSDEEDREEIDQTATSTEIEETPFFHPVISEVFFDAEGGDGGKEFVELYNQNEEAISLDGWLVAYLKDGSMATSTLVKIGGKEDDIDVILPHGFFLVGLNSYDASDTGIEADALRSSSLPNGDIEESVAVVLVDYRGKEVDRLIYGGRSDFVPGNSIERRAINEAGVCISASGEGETLGNGCDTGSIEDFEIRATPRPQNSLSFSEPRNPPGISGFSVVEEFSSTSLRTAFSWRLVADLDGDTSSISYVISDITDPESREELFRSVSVRKAYIPMHEVGREYIYEFKVEDKDGAFSATTTEISAPGFLKDLYVYKDPRSSNYLAEFRYDTYPFIPTLWSDPSALKWQAAVLYMNRMPNLANSFLVPGNDWFPDDVDGVMSVRTRTGNTVIFGLRPEVSDGKSFSTLRERSFLLPNEDNRFTVPLFSTTADLALSSNDYFTVAYYDIEEGSAAANAQILRLVAADRTKYFFRETRDFQKPPSVPGNVSISFDKFESTLGISWDASTDPDSPDSSITYETNFSRFDIGEDGWVPAEPRPAGEGGSEVYDIGQLNPHKIAVRARDEFGNVSDAVVLEWEPTGDSTLYFKSDPYKTVSQDFYVEKQGKLESIELFSSDAFLPGPLSDNFLCFLDLRKYVPGGLEHVTGNDLPYLLDTRRYQNNGYGCAGRPVKFTYRDANITLVPGVKYNWSFRFNDTNAQPTIRFYGREADEAGGEFSGGDFNEAIFTVRSVSDVLLTTE